TFSNSQFNVEGFRMYRVDRNAHGGGLMIFIRNDICFRVVTRFNVDMSSFRTKSMLLKVKINKSWFAIVGIYRPPNIPKVKPNKLPMDGRDLCDLLDIYNLKNLITLPTGRTDKITTISISFLQTTMKEYYHRAW
ncbi:unnamed protein product, partial [Porites lobata]